MRKTPLIFEPLGGTKGDTEELLSLCSHLHKAPSTKLEGHLPNIFPNQLPFKTKVKKDVAL